MRSGSILLWVALAALVAAGIWWWRSPGAEPATLLPAQPQLDLSEQRAMAQRMAVRVDERPTLAPSRRDPVVAPPGEATAVRLRIVDHDTRQPVAGARMLDIASGAWSPPTAADGELRLARARGGTFAIVADDYLAKLPTAGDDDDAALQRGARADDVVDIALRRDDYTLACALRFVAADGALAAGPVRFTIACLDQPPPTAMAFPTGRLAPGATVDPAIYRAWQQNVAVQMLPPVDGSLLHLGVQSNNHVFVAEGGRAAMRFVAAGRYRVAAVAPAAMLAGEQDIHVAPGASGPIDVRLAPGRYVTGIAVDANDGRPVPAVSVHLVDAVASAVTDTETGPDGVFRLGPVAGSTVTVSATSRLYLDLTATLTVGVEGRLTLSPRSTRVVRGVVRQRPSLAPIVGASVLLRRGLETEVEARTLADGTFALSTVAEAPELVVRAPGFLTWVEVIRELQDSYVCDLWPDELEARVAAGVSAVIEGRVLGADGKPVAGVPVQLFSDEAPVPEGIPGRVVVEGNTLPLRPLAVTDATGTFVLEWHQPGIYRLLAIDGLAAADDGLPVTLALGQRLRDVVLHTAR